MKAIHGLGPLVNLWFKRQNLGFICGIFFLCNHHQALPATFWNQVSPIVAVSFSPKGDQLLLGSQKGIEIRTWPENTTSGTLKTDLKQVNSLVFSPDGKWLVVCGGNPAQKGSVEIRNWPDQSIVQRWDLHKDILYRVAFSPNGKHLATASHDGTCKIVDAQTGKILNIFEGHSRPVMAIAFLPDTNLVVSTGFDQTVQVWDSETGKSIRSMDNHTSGVNDLAIQPGKHGALPVIATVGEDRTIRLWQPSIGRLVKFSKLNSIPRSITWNRDGKHFFVGCDDGTIRFIDADTMQIKRSSMALNGRIHALALNSQGNRIVVAGENGFVVIPW